ncbi:MAG: D-glucuronyl C5-epimerase family protein [Acidobacteriota bacterium]
MRLDHKLIDVLYRARDLWRGVRGHDAYQDDWLGQYFLDGKSYFTDFRCRAQWHGAYRDNVPVLYMPSLSRTLFFPMTIMQYGLGSIDRYFETGQTVYLEKVRHVTRWLFANCNENGYLDNLFRDINSNPRIEYYSNNSAMTQGHAISFLVRVTQQRLLPDLADEAARLAVRLSRNLMLPVDQGGASLYRGRRVYLCEYCRKDDYVILNGWIFALFGLYDYCGAFPGSEADAHLGATLDTLCEEIERFVRPDNWSYYDNQRRFSSPTYQLTHISQCEAMFRLTNRSVFRAVHDRLVLGYNFHNRLKYAVRKIPEKLVDSHRYVTARADSAR